MTKAHVLIILASVGAFAFAIWVHGWLGIVIVAFSIAAVWGILELADKW